MTNPPFDWTKVKGLGQMSREEAMVEAGKLSEEDRAQIKEQANREITEAKDDMWALVEDYQARLSENAAKGISSDSSFFGLWGMTAKEEIDNPTEHTRLVRLLHTALFELASAAEQLEATQDGSRRMGRNRRG